MKRQYDTSTPERYAFFHLIRYRYDIWLFLFDTNIVASEKTLFLRIFRRIFGQFSEFPENFFGEKRQNKSQFFSIEDTRYWRFDTIYASILGKVSRYIGIREFLNTIFTALDTSNNNMRRFSDEPKVFSSLIIITWIGLDRIGLTVGYWCYLDNKKCLAPKELHFFHC